MYFFINHLKNEMEKKTYNTSRLGFSENLSITSISNSFFFSKTNFLWTLIKHIPFKRFSVIVNLNHVSTRLNMLNDLSIVLVEQGCAIEIVRAFFMAGKNVLASLITLTISKSFNDCRSRFFSLHTLYHNSASDSNPSSS